MSESNSTTGSPGFGPGATLPLDTTSMAGSLIACAVLCWVICGVGVGARFYARGRIQNVLAREDWCVLAAWLLALGFTVGTIYAAKYGLGSHIWTMTPEKMSHYMLTSWVLELFYQLSLTLSKMSILFLYIRVFEFQWASRAAWFMLAVVVVYNIWGFISTMTLCIPLQAYWDPTVHGDCKPVSYMWAAIGLHITTDFLIFLIPIPVVWSMIVPVRQKIGLFLIFALGFFVCLISILRVVFINQLFSSQDFSWDYISIGYWNCIEVNGAIVIPCLVVLKPIFRKFWPTVFSSSHEPINGFDYLFNSKTSSNRTRIRRLGRSSRSRDVEEAESKDDLGLPELSSHFGPESDVVKEPPKTYNQSS